MVERNRDDWPRAQNRNKNNNDRRSNLRGVCIDVNNNKSPFHRGSHAPVDLFGYFCYELWTVASELFFFTVNLM